MVAKDRQRSKAFTTPPTSRPVRWAKGMPRADSKFEPAYDTGVEIYTPRLLLRRFREDDLEAFVAYRRDPDVARFQSWDTSYSIDDARAFFAQQLTLEPGQAGDWLQLAIEQRANGALCGDCGVQVLTEQPRTAELGITLASLYQKRGVGAEALAAIIRWLFGELNVHRVFANADDRNVRMQQLLERLGFRLEARFIDADWFKGEWTTLRVYALLRRDWTSDGPS